MAKDNISAIKVLRGCGASGVSLVAGAVYAVPAQVSEKDAGILIQLGKAEATAEAKPKVKKDKDAE